VCICMDDEDNRHEFGMCEASLAKPLCAMFAFELYDRKVLNNVGMIDHRYEVSCDCVQVNRKMEKKLCMKLEGFAYLFVTVTWLDGRCFWKESSGEWTYGRTLCEN